VPRGRVVGVDSSEDMIRAAAAAWPALGGRAVEFLVQDARALTFDGEFDVAFSNAALHWVHDQPAVLRGVARALRPGGRLAFQMGGSGNGAEIFAVAQELSAHPRWAAHFNGFAFPWSFLRPEEYEPLCRDAGLTVKRIQLLPRTMRQQGRSGLAGWIRTTWLPYLERVPAARREEFIQSALDIYLARRPLATDGAAEVDMVRLQVEAVRA
jgi:trans-aconitate 2-methyltransferase